jgi:sec-independent protein translocase protein TatB
MFDIGFSELLVIGVVALIVIGPERLPRVARTLGHLFGRMQRYVNDVKADISREMELEELRKLQTDVQDAARSFEDTVTKEIRDTETQLQSVADTVTAPPAVPQGFRPHQELPARLPPGSWSSDWKDRPMLSLPGTDSLLRAQAA